MMSSTGSGTYRVGGSGSLLSSSSNLSPLAPPFRVDKPLPKPTSTNPMVNYPDVPMYGPYFEPVSQFWDPCSSSAPGTSFMPTEPLGTNASCPLSTGIYGYPSSQPSNTPANAYHVASGGAAAYDPFSYEPFPKNMSTTAEEGGKPYYTPFVSAPPQKEGYLSLGVGSGHGYEMLSKSGSSNLSGCGSSQVDHPPDRSAEGDLKLNWGSFWSGGNESEQDKWPDYGHGFGSKNLNLSDSSSSKSPFLNEGSNKGRPFVDISTHPFVDGSSNTNLPCSGNSRSHLKQGTSVNQESSSHGNVSTASDGCFDIFGGTYHLGTLGINKRDSRSLRDCSRRSTPVSASVSKERPCLQEPDLESVKSFCGSQKASGSSPEDHISQSGFYMFGCTSTTSTFPVGMNKLTFGGSSFSAENTPLDVNLNSMGSDTSKKSNTLAGYDSYQNQPQFPLGSKRQSSVIIRRPQSVLVTSSSEIGETAERKGVSEKNQFATEIPHLFSSDGFNPEVNPAQAAYSAEKLSGGSDGHTPAEDSPCWRGASSNRFSPFGVSEGLGSDVFAKNLDEYISTQDPHITSRVIHAPDFRDNSSVCMSQHEEEQSSADLKSLPFDLNSRDGLQFNEGRVNTKESSILNKSKTDSEPRVTLGAQPISVIGKILPSSRMSEAAGLDESEDQPPAGIEKSSGSPSKTKSSYARSPPGDNASFKYCQSTSVNSDSKFDVDVLVKTMTKLSEIFRCQCSINQAALLEEHSVAIKHIISNLNSSLLVMAGTTTPSMHISPDTSFQQEAPLSQMLDDSRAVAAAAKIGGSAEGFMDFVSSNYDVHTVGDASMTQAMKKILLDNFHEDGLDQQKLLYKNLWLEAEASLCAMTAKARFLQLKAEMESTQDGSKDRINAPSSIISDDVHGSVGVPSQEKDPLASSECPKSSAISQNIHIKGAAGNDSDGSGITGHTNEVEASVVDRYQILKNRIGNSDTGNHECGQSSSGNKNPSYLNASEKVFQGADTTSDLKDAENAVSTRYQILKCRLNPESLNYDFNPGEDNHMPDRDSPSPKYKILGSLADNSDSIYARDSVSPKDPFESSHLLSNSVPGPEEVEASVMARFRILQSRINQINSVRKDQTPGYTSGQAGESETEQPCLSHQKSNVIVFGPYPDFTENEEVKQSGKSGYKDIYSTSSCKARELDSEIIESWYDNDCSSSDWEHVSKEDFRRPS